MFGKGLASVISVECPLCGSRLDDLDPPVNVHGLAQVTARCHRCHTEQVLEIDSWRGETRVTGIRNSPWTPPGQR